MPFNPNTGVWETGGDHAWTMPTTSAGDIVGGFNSAQAFQQNQEEQRLRMLLQQLAAQQTQYKMGREQEQGTREDEFRAGLQPSVAAGSGMELAPRINSEEDYEKAILGLDPMGAAKILERKDANRDRIDSQEARKMYSDALAAVRAGQDPEPFAQALTARFPNYPHLAASIRGARIDPKTEAQTNLANANTQLANTKRMAIEEITPRTAEGMRLKNEILKLKVAAGGTLTGKGKTAGGLDMNKIARLWLSVTSRYMGNNDIKKKMLAEDPEAFEAGQQELSALGETLHGLLQQAQSAPVSAGSETPAPAPGGMPQGFKQGDKVYDFTKP